MLLYESILACDPSKVKAMVEECNLMFAQEGHTHMPDQSKILLEEETKRLYGDNGRQLLLIPTDRVGTIHHRTLNMALVT